MPPAVPIGSPRPYCTRNTSRLRGNMGCAGTARRARRHRPRPALPPSRRRRACRETPQRWDSWCSVERAARAVRDDRATCHAACPRGTAAALTMVKPGPRTCRSSRPAPVSPPRTRTHGSTSAAAVPKHPVPVSAKPAAAQHAVPPCGRRLARAARIPLQVSQPAIASAAASRSRSARLFFSAAVFNCPQAAPISCPRVRRTGAEMPPSNTISLNARMRSGVEHS